MLKTLLVLKDGTEVFSGFSDKSAVQSCTIKESVNDSRELTLGSACANMLEVKFLLKNGDINISAGDEVAAYKVDETGTRHKVGLFTVEEPTRPTANTMNIVAFDRVTWLDKDLAQWLTDLHEWPYSLFRFAGMVCEQCGLSLKNTEIPNGDYMVQKFAASSVTGRKLMQWIGQIAGRFCRATTAGEIEFAWYEPSGVSITPDGDRFYYQNGLSFEKYQVEPIEKVQIKLTTDDVGVVWPNETGEKNTYVISGNYLLTAAGTSALLPLAQTLYEHLKDVIYTPFRVTIPAGTDLHAGHTVQIIDQHGKSFTSYVMNKTQSGQRDTLESTGSQNRSSTSVVNQEGYRALNRQVLEIKRTVEGFSMAASKLETLQIGARNLIRKSGNMIFKDYQFSGTENVLESYTGEILGTDDECAKFSIEDAADHFILYGVKKIGEQYTFNCYAKAETPGSVTVDGSKFQVSDNWSRLEMTYVAENTALTIAFGNTGNFYIYHPQLEVGNMPTDYSPAPEDLEDYVLQSETALGQNIEIVRESTTKLEADSESLRASVGNLESVVDATKNEVIATRNEVASLNLQQNQLEVKIEQIENDGVEKVVNTTGVFDKDGLTIDKTDSPTKTQVTPDGMIVYKKSYGDQTEVLKATSDGVDATNLHAKTYLIVGGRSRFENYKTDKTGCFWIGE